jgi:hypothetical protein
MKMMTLMGVALAAMSGATFGQTVESTPFYQGPATMTTPQQVSGKVVGVNRPGQASCVLLQVDVAGKTSTRSGLGGAGHLVLCGVTPSLEMGQTWEGRVQPVGTQRVPVAGGKTFQRVEPVQ